MTLDDQRVRGNGASILANDNAWSHQSRTILALAGLPEIFYSARLSGLARLAVLLLTATGTVTLKPVYPLDELAARVQGEVRGDGRVSITGIAPLAEAESGELSFYADEKYRKELARTHASAIITESPLKLSIPQVIHPDPALAVNALLELFFPRTPLNGQSRRAEIAPDAEVSSDAGIGPFVVIGPQATVGPGSQLHAGVVIGASATIGANCVLAANVVVGERCRLGDRVRIHAGAVIGSDGFGYARRGTRFEKLRHCGIVVLEDDVEIGANATIDRATLGCTVLRRGVKLDNLVHIGHNVEIGEDSIMAAQGGVSGSTQIGRRVMMGGQVGMVDHLTVGDDAVLIAQSGVIGNVAPGTMVSGYPARPHRQVLKAQAALRRLDRLQQRVRELEQRMNGDESHTPSDD